MNNCIVTQIHIPDWDTQGGLRYNDKLEMLDLSIRHLRKFNPEAYIILTGHGHVPYKKTLELCDWHYWENECRPLNPNGTVKDMPAQFFFVSRGIHRAIEKGFTRIVKTRGDCLIFRTRYNVTMPIVGCYILDKYTPCYDVFEDILNTETKSLLVTQQTGRARYKLGDCLMYGDIEILDKVWSMHNPVRFEEDGVVNTGMNYAAIFGNVQDYESPEAWQKLLRDTVAFRDVTSLGFMDLRHNWRSIERKEDVLEDWFDFKPYAWGRANGWHIHDGVKMVNAEAIHYNEGDFYAHIA